MMRKRIPWEEIEAKLMARPGFAEACEQARREFDEEIAIYGTIDNPKPQPRPELAKHRKTKRPFTLHRARTRATAV